MVEVKILSTPIDVSYCVNAVMSPSTGGIDVFVGTVRNATNGNAVVQLEFEAYERMALAEMQKIANEAMRRWQLNAIVIHHRTGTLIVGDVPVVIAVAAPHRAAAFEACRYAIDTLKQTVPIWKKEVYEDGAEWVAAHP
jgi:molybdopterin synthase catalytic subunit